MAKYSCTLGLSRRLWPVVDGEHYHGEIMRFRLHAELERTSPDPALDKAPVDYQVELRISGTLLAESSWDAFSVREVTAHGMAYLRECIERQGLPQQATTTYTLNEQTQDGAFVKGSPYADSVALVHRPFVVHGNDSALDTRKLSTH